MLHVLLPRQLSHIIATASNKPTVRIFELRPIFLWLTGRPFTVACPQVGNRLPTFIAFGGQQYAL